MAKYYRHSKRKTHADMVQTRRVQKKQQALIDKRESDGIEQLSQALEQLTLGFHAPKKWTLLTYIYYGFLIFNACRLTMAEPLKHNNAPSTPDCDDTSDPSTCQATSLAQSPYSPSVSAIIQPSASITLLAEYTYLQQKEKSKWKTHGKFYSNKKGEKFLIKPCQDNSFSQCLNEVVGSRLVAEIAGSDASLEPVFPVFDDDNMQMLIASKWNPYYSNRKNLDRAFHYENGIVTWNGHQIDNLWMIPAISVFLQDWDINTGNFGILAHPSSEPRIIKMDLGGAFEPNMIAQQMMTASFEAISPPCHVVDDSPHLSTDCLFALTSRFYERIYKTTLSSQPHETQDLLSALDQILTISETHYGSVAEEEIERFKGYLGPIYRELHAKMARLGYLTQSGAAILEEDIAKSEALIRSIIHHNYNGFSAIRDRLIQYQDGSKRERFQL